MNPRGALVGEPGLAHILSRWGMVVVVTEGWADELGRICHLLLHLCCVLTLIKASE